MNAIDSLQNDPPPQIHLGEVHLWTASLEAGPASLEKAEALLSDEEKARASRFVHRVDRDNYITCHGMVRSIIARYIQIPAAELKFKTEEQGKPCLDERINPSGLKFNFSHSGQRMLLGLVLNSRIGVDIEQIRLKSASMDVARRFFTEYEHYELSRLSGHERVLGFFNCWTRKEAYLKAIGCGLSTDPRACEVTLRPGAEPRILRRLPNDKSSDWSLFHHGNEAGYVSALAVDRPDAKFKTILS